MVGELRCPMCDPGAARSDALDVLILDLIGCRSLSENAEGVLRAAWSGRGATVSAEQMFDELYRFDPDGGPRPARMYADLRAALSELREKLAGTGLALVSRKNGRGWRISFVSGGAYVH